MAGLFYFHHLVLPLIVIRYPLIVVRVYDYCTITPENFAPAVIMLMLTPTPTING